ncbi:MAG: methyltransferase type 11, partial [Ignavibacteria bacterium]|nr:methyltransferase type 11 [Ignavibacteria bacterium]
YHFFRMLGWFRKAGLEKTYAKTFAGSVYAPLSNEIRTALISLIQMRWTSLKSELSSDDLEEFQRLVKPESPDFILNLPDYYAFFTYSLFYGKIPK